MALIDQNLVSAEDSKKLLTFIFSICSVVAYPYCLQYEGGGPAFVLFKNIAIKDYRFSGAC